MNEKDIENIDEIVNQIFDVRRQLRQFFSDEMNQGHAMLVDADRDLLNAANCLIKWAMAIGE